jgi:tetratricopeptide (TPR) repeat protein
MDNADYIESYFTSSLTTDRAREFEKRIESDPAFAEEVAFYLSALKVSRETTQSEKKLHFKEIYQKNYGSGTTPVRKVTGTPVRKLVYYIAAAAVVTGIVFGIRTLIQPVSPTQLASQYVNEHLHTLGVTMSSHSDSLQNGIRLYNEGKPAEALVQFEKIIQGDTSNFTAKKYAGIAALRLKDFDRALVWFNELETYTGLYANPALLFQALTLMERNESGDDVKAKKLLQQIVQSDGEGKETAEEWLKKLN